LHLAAILSLCLAGLSNHWVLAVSFLLLISWGSNVWAEGLRQTPNAIVNLKLTEAGWQLGLRSGKWLVVELLPEVVLLPWLVVLRFRRCDVSQGRKLAVALFPDSVPEPGLRHLRAVLRVYSPEKAER
jgi:hypothetical protein